MGETCSLSFKKRFITVKPPVPGKVQEVFILEINYIYIDSVSRF